METKIITTNNIDLAIESLNNGQTIAFKTDTIYGLSCIATDSEACENLAKIKGREDKPLILLMSKDTDLSHYIGDISPEAKKIISHFWPGPITIIFPLRYPFCDTITRGGRTIAIRVPDDTLCEQILSQIGKPLVSTSANLTGEPALNSPTEILEKFRGKIPYIIDSGLPHENQSSTIISVVDNDVKILREGKVAKDEILAILK
ncbi:MAG: threonylcarbamoyl-AMP synthase [Clostridiales bacterium]|nr:threonylcarbamoyl-AMP synthase [Clostridiales bacterium]